MEQRKAGIFSAFLFERGKEVGEVTVVGAKAFALTGRFLH